MARYKLVVMSNPLPGREDEYNNWYSNEHVPDLMKVNGIVSGERLVLKSGSEQWRYLALYELDTEEPEAVVGEIMARVESGEFTHSDSMDIAGAYNGIYESFLTRTAD